MSAFTGLGAFPLTPIVDDRVDESAFVRIIARLAASGVDSITALGSTGSAAYLDPQERARVAALAVEHAGAVPVLVGVGALRTSDVRRHIDGAEAAGAAGLLLAPMSYQPLTDDEVFELFRTAVEHTALPVVVYDNPGTTHFSFTIDLYARIAALPGIASIKIPGVPRDPDAARRRIRAIRAVVPAQVTVGVSGDASGVDGLRAGCDAWYSAIAGTVPEPFVRMVAAVAQGRADDAVIASERFAPLWELFAAHGGSLRVIAVIAEHLGLVTGDTLPQPIRGLTGADRRRVIAASETLGLA